MKKIVALIAVFFVIFSNVTYGEDGLLNQGASKIEYALYKGDTCVRETEKAEILPVGSVSKVFASAAAVVLSEQGALDLYKPVCEYLPEFKMEDERYKDITAEMLMNHTSGLYGSTLKNSLLFGDKDTYNHDSFLDMLKCQRLKAAPSEMVSYCNDGYTLLEILIEKVSQKAYSDFLKEFVFDKIGLENTMTVENYKGEEQDFVNSLASGGLFSVPGDLCKFALSLKEIISADGTELMGKAADTKYLDGVLNPGLGWENVSLYPFSQYDIRAFVKNGDTNYHHSSLLVLPDLNIAAAVITEGGSGISCQLAAVNIISDYLRQEKICDVQYEAPKFEGDYSKKDYTAFEGLYLSNSAQYYVTVDKNILNLFNIYEGKSRQYQMKGLGKFGTADTNLFFDEIEGEKYIVIEGTTEIKGLGKYKYREYAGVKREKLQEEISPLWEERNGNIYLLCDEKYTSQIYMQSMPLASVFFKEESSGYVGYMKMENDNLAVADICLPGLYGRDLMDLEFYTENETEYLKSQGWTFVDFKSVPFIYGGEKSVCTIKEDGFARWFKIGDLGGKTADIMVDSSGSYTVYDGRGIVVHSSLLSEECPVLPKNGYIVFAGEKGTVFDINLK